MAVQNISAIQKYLGWPNKVKIWVMTVACLKPVSSALCNGICTKCVVILHIYHDADSLNINRSSVHEAKTKFQQSRVRQLKLEFCATVPLTVH